jgi:hypothetical protein
MLGDRLTLRPLPSEGTGMNRGRYRRGVSTRRVEPRISRESKLTPDARHLECTWSGVVSAPACACGSRGLAASSRTTGLQTAMHSACGETRVWLLSKSNSCRQSHLMPKPHHCGVFHEECPWHLDVSRGNRRFSEYPTLGPRTNADTFANSGRTVKQKYTPRLFHPFSPALPGRRARG